MRRYSPLPMPGLLPPLALALGLALISQTTALPSQPSNSTSAIKWTNCTNKDPPNLQCAQIQAPIDYKHQNGEQFTLFIARLKANGTSRVGSLVYNPGGPGGSASEAVIATAQGITGIFSQNLISSYDIIGLDPRGVGQSNPIKCDPTILNTRISTFPKTDDEFNALVNRNKAFGASCKNKTGALLDHMDTTHFVQDIEFVRQALDDGELNFLGLSYGTMIGAAYAEAYPKNVGRMVIDGITDHSASEMDFITSAAATYEATLNKFFQWCNTTSSCALHGKDVAGILDNLIIQAEKKPIPAPGCSTIGQSACLSDVSGDEILWSVKNGLAPGLSAWPALSLNIVNATQGDATALSASYYNEETSPFFSAAAISCQDFTQTTKSLVDLTLRKQMMGILAPHTNGMSMTWNLYATCIGWPATLTNPQHVLASKVKSAPPVLLVNSLWDPATSIEWANSVRLQMPNSVLVVRNGAGHTSYGQVGKTTMAIDAFLVNGTMPAQGTMYDN
jgi:pimeloyl-ACP methyl ester carboxylesterase